MNTNKIKIKHFFLPFMLLIFMGCKKSFLEIDPQQDTDVSRVAEDLPGARAAIIGVYTRLKPETYYGRSMILIPEIMSDNAFLSRRNSNRYQSYDRYGITINDSYARSLWDEAYRVIVNANLLIQKVTTTEYPSADQAEIDQILGEAYAIRALSHFDLVRLFAQPYNFTPGATHPGIPVVIKSGTVKSEIINPSRNTVEEVYKQIETDLKTALEYLPKTPKGFSKSLKGRISFYAAEAILSKVYLYMEKWENAEQHATSVIDSKAYTLLGNANFATDFSKQDNTETIFELQYSMTNRLSSDALANFLLQNGSYGDGLASMDLYNQYGSTDVRRNFLKIGKRSGTGGEDPAVMVQKYSNITTYEEGVKVIRLGEVHLIRAEARAHIPGKTAEAAADLDKIAQRSEPTKASSIAIGNDLINEIIQERRKELAFEGDRLFDLRRNKKSFTKYMSDDSMEIPYSNLKTILPIPLAEMNANGNIEQNEGYK